MRFQAKEMYVVNDFLSKQRLMIKHDQDNKNAKEKRANLQELKNKKAWEVAKSPMSSIFMTGLMTWLSGASVNIFSISITIYTIINAVKGIFSVGTCNIYFISYILSFFFSSMQLTKLIFINAFSIRQIQGPKIFLTAANDSFCNVASSYDVYRLVQSKYTRIVANC